MAQRTRCRKVERADPLAQALGIGHGARQRGMAHDLNKFFAAVTPEDIARAQSLLHCLRKSLQDAIARQMIELVVVALEEIEIDDANRKRFAGEVRASFRLFHGNQQSATVVNACQFVVARLLFDVFQFDGGFSQAALQSFHAHADEHEPRQRDGHHDELQHVEAEHFQFAVAPIAEC